MKKSLSIVLALLLCLFTASCAPAKEEAAISSGSGVVEFTSSSSQEELPVPPAESPAAVESSSAAPAPASQPTSSQPIAPGPPSPAAQEVRAVWVSYLELSGLMKDQSDSQFRAGIAQVMQRSADYGLNTIILQVRPYGDAIYPSQLFPQSYLFTGEEGGVGEAPYDALQIALEEAHRRHLRLEAWINPYRIRTKGDRPLCADNPANALLKSGGAVKLGETITYNPASKAAQKLIVEGVTELVKNYEVDGIHFDDYFYPTVDAAFDSDDYSRYKAAGGTQALGAWRRSNVTALVRQVHDAIQRVKPTVLFGISPQGNMHNNLEVQFVDVEELIKAQLVDYICPQVYFGFKNSDCPYQSTLESFNTMAKGTGVRVYAGLATYKLGTVDTWAGDGKNEWIGTTDLLRRQVESARKLSRYGGFALYRYDSTFSCTDSKVQSQLTTELDNLQALLK